MKWIVRGIFLVIVLFVLFFLGVFLVINPALKEGVERGGTYAMGVDTTLDGIALGVFSGRLELSKLNVANPEGFDHERFFSLGQGVVDLSLPSLLEDTVIVPSVKLDGIEMNLEQQGGQANVQMILENLKKVADGGGQEGGEAPGEGGKGKGFQIEELVISDVRVSTSWEGQEGTVRIGEIALTEIGTETEGGVVLSQLSAIVLKAILEAVVANAGGRIPESLSTELARGLESLDSIKGYKLGDVKGVTTDALGAAVEQATAKIEEQVEQQKPAAEEKLREATEEGRKQVEESKTAAEEKLREATEEGKKQLEGVDQGLKGLEGSLGGESKDAKRPDSTEK